MRHGLLLVSCLLFIFSRGMAQREANVEVRVDASSGNYTISSKKLHWTFSGTVGQALQQLQTTTSRDEVGVYESYKFTWNNGLYAGTIRRYKQSPVVIFTLTLPKGTNAPLPEFPNFNSFPASLHHFSYHDDVFAAPNFLLNHTSTPWLLFDDANRACIISPASHFIVAKMKGDGVHKIASGLNEEIQQYPEEFSYSTIMVLDTGIRKSWNNWGTALRNLYHRKYPDNDKDSLLKYFGYWTDNGADYYYNYDTTIGYVNTLLKLKKYYQQQGIPLGYMQLDSWWYEKSVYDPDGQPIADHKNKNLPYGAWNRYGGLLEYKTDSFLFPKGLTDFQQKLGLPLATHNRWIDATSPYIQRFRISGVAAIDTNYWKEIMNYIHASNVVCYEQDWLNYIYSKTPKMASDLTVGDLFTDGMANEADKLDIHLQYCMAMPRYFLQGLKYNNLTTIRTSEDRFDPGKWYPFIFTSQLAYETGAMPWCDVFKSNELGNMILSVLSSGPVGTGDAIGKENKHNIFLACREDGQLVRPDIPILPLDKDYIALAKKQQTPLLAYTYTQHQNITTNYLFAFCNKRNSIRTFSVSPSEVHMKGEIVVYNPLTGKIADMHTSGTTTFADSIPSSNYTYYIFAPVTSSGIAFLGDKNKIAATGKKRIASIISKRKHLKIKVLFATNEKQVVLQGYCKSDIKSNQGTLQINNSTHLFQLIVDKPENKNETEIVLSRK
ncbi:hypothetical protein A9P82_07985 [Arachidicoccus ginsenosidimutans]|uniref:hypothetical protein n=1 Tax=Arachidicoccus sp. BS20 TaxID=1850526 RepID=UPI0007F0680C|nr:hypothetical protein [Arachidicoccus sp. BS20]ANI89234.1 hypothetical protein A9P82_07985 [Arachidicoccus sp. BS20]